MSGAEDCLRCCQDYRAFCCIISLRSDLHSQRFWPFGCLCRTGGFCWCVLLGVDFYWLNCISGFLWSDCHCSFCLHGLVLMSSTRRFQYLSIPVDGTVKIGNACIWLLARSSQPTEPRVSTWGSCRLRNWGILIYGLSSPLGRSWGRGGWVGWISPLFYS